MKLSSLIALLCTLLLSSSIFAANPKVTVDTNYGAIEIELFQDKAPVSVKNFLRYTDAKLYDGTIFHRVINNFMIQGGGFDKSMKKVKNFSGIKNEATNGISNDAGTVAMARTQDINSATNQFFINVNNNNFLNHAPGSMDRFGYAVFGRITKGMSVVNRIKLTKTTTKGQYSDVPVEPIFIKSVTRNK